MNFKDWGFSDPHYGTPFITLFTLIYGGGVLSAPSPLLPLGPYLRNDLFNLNETF